VTSRRQTILDALVGAFSVVTTANGYNTDLADAGGTQKVLSPANALESMPMAVVSIYSEQRSTELTQHWQNRLRFSVLGFIAEVEGTPIEDQLEDLLEDLENVLITEKLRDQPLSVDGVLDLELDGHDKHQLDDRALAVVEIQGTVIYRHNIDNPGAWS